MALRALLFAPLILLAASTQDRFTSGTWEGKANFGDEGQFLDCTMTMRAANKTQLGIVITSDSDIGLLVADQTLQLEIGTRKAVILHMDGTDPVPAIGRVIETHGLLIPLRSSKALVAAMRATKTMRISLSQKEFSFRLEGTDAAIEALIGCVKSHRGTSRIEL